MKTISKYVGGSDFLVALADYGLAERLGYASAEAAWADNPVIESSVVPSDLRVVGPARKR